MYGGFKGRYVEKINIFKELNPIHGPMSFAAKKKKKKKKTKIKTNKHLTLSYKNYTHSLNPTSSKRFTSKTETGTRFKSAIRDVK